MTRLNRFPTRVRCDYERIRDPSILIDEYFDEWWVTRTVRRCPWLSEIVSFGRQRFSSGRPGHQCKARTQARTRVRPRDLPLLDNGPLMPLAIRGIRMRCKSSGRTSTRSLQTLIG